MDYSREKKEIGLRIKSYRQHKGLTQEKLGNIIELDSNNISNLEKGKNFPDIKTLIKLISNTDIEPNYLLGFLQDKTVKFESIDFEILRLIINLKQNSKQHIKDLLLSLKRR